MPNSITLRPQARKFLDKLNDAVLYARLRSEIDGLALNPRPAGCTKLAAKESLYRIRVGDYRVLYQVHDPASLVVVVAIGHRREIYR
jgi:mRNA interferase RelE/StbE